VLLKLTDKIQECKTVSEAHFILDKYNVGRPVKKLVETAINYAESNDRDDRVYAGTCMKSAIKEIKDANEDQDIDDLDITEEELDNHNRGTRTEGSDQSTENTEPFTGQGENSTSGEKPIDKIEGAVNQWNEAGPLPAGGNGNMMQQPLGPPGGMMPPAGGMPNQMATPPNGSAIVSGIAPTEMHEPQMNPQMQQYVKSIIDQEMSNYHNNVTSPTREILKQTIREQAVKINMQGDALKLLSVQNRETHEVNNSMKLDMTVLRENATAKFRETEPSTFVKDSGTIQDARSEITEMDRILRTKPSEIYG